jgi:DNA invertase Pin-like site-specific DNA recombinase
MTAIGYVMVQAPARTLVFQLEKLGSVGSAKIFQEKRSGVDAGRPELVACLDYLREGDLLLVCKIDGLPGSTGGLYKIVSRLQSKGVEFKVIDDPSIDTTSRTGKLVMGILAPKTGSLSRPTIKLLWPSIEPWSSSPAAIGRELSMGAVAW